MANTYAHFLLGHDCQLPVEYGGLARLPPNAPLFHKMIRWLRNFLSPNPNLSISKRNIRNTSQINAETRRHARGNFFYIIHPYSSMEFYREIMYLFIGIWEIINTPLIATFFWVAYKSPDHLDMSKKIPSSFRYCDMFVTGFEVLWIISCFFTGYKHGTGKYSVELNHFKIVKRYLTSYFLIDLLTLSPAMSAKRLPYWNIMHFFNVAVVLRCPTIIKFLNRFFLDLKLPQQVITCIILVALSFFFVHLFACVFYVLPIMTYDGTQNIWVENRGLYPNHTINLLYFGCFSIVQVHFWGLGESTTRIENYMEELVLTVVMVVGRLWSLFVIASMLRVFAISSLSETKYEQYLMQLQTFISHNNLPKDLEEKLLKYYEHRYQHHFFNEKSIFSCLSQYLIREISLFRARNVIGKVQIFRFFPRSMIADIIAKCKILVFMNNDYVLKPGDPMDHVYFIGSGTIAVFNDEKYELIHLSDGDDVGMKGVTSFDDVEYTHTYISIETTEVYAINIKDFRSIVYSQPDILKFFQKKVEDRAALYNKLEALATAQGVDILSELKHDKVLERPRIRTRFFD